MCLEECACEERSAPASVRMSRLQDSDEQRLLDTWAPGAGIPCYSFGPTKERKRTERLFKTSVLFLELEVLPGNFLFLLFFLYNLNLHFTQAKVKNEIKARHAKEIAERDLSLEIARKHPLTYNNSANKLVSKSEINPQQSTDVDENAFESASKRQRLEEASGASTSGLRKATELPAPLTQEVLFAALRELPAGPLAALKTCLSCWRHGRLASSELVSTARSFAAASPTLRQLFSSPKAAPLSIASELATPDQMRELALLAAAAPPRTPILA